MTPVIFRAGEFALERQKNTRDSISRTANVMKEDILQALYQTGSVYDDGYEDDLIEMEEEQMQIDKNNSHSDREEAVDGSNSDNDIKDEEDDGQLNGDNRSEAESKDSRVHSEDLLASDDDYEQFAQRGDWYGDTHMEWRCIVWQVWTRKSTSRAIGIGFAFMLGALTACKRIAEWASQVTAKNYFS